MDVLAQHPGDPNRLYAGGWDLRSNGGDLFESRDAGVTWKRVVLPAASPALRDFAISRDNPSRMIAGALDGVFVTQDGGATWRKAVKDPGFRNVESVAIDPRNPRILFVGTWRLAYRSMDFGRTWLRVSRGMYFDSDVFSIAVDARKRGVVYASACSGLYRSDNLADTWRRLRVLPDRFGVRAHVVEVDPIDSGRVYGGTTEGLFLSRDGGQSWKRVTSRLLTINAVQVDPRSNKRVLIGTGNQGVLRSEDGGNTWVESNTGFVRRQISRIVPDPEVSGHFYAGVLSDGRKGGFYLFNNHENRWVPLTSEIVASVPEVLSFLPLGTDRGRLAGSAKGIYWQQPSAASWVRLAGEIGSVAVHDLTLDTENSWIYAATGRGIYRARPDALEFSKPSDPRFSPVLLSITVSRSGQPALYAGGNLGVVRSRDQGATWEILSAGLPARAVVECVAVSPLEEDHLFAGTPAGLFESTDRGASWKKARDGRLVGVDVPSVIFLDPSGSRIMAADNTFGGVFLSEDGGKSWEKIEAPAFRSPVRALAQDPARPEIIYLGTNSEGVYRLRLLMK